MSSYKMSVDIGPNREYWLSVFTLSDPISNRNNKLLYSRNCKFVILLYVSHISIGQSIDVGFYGYS